MILRGGRVRALLEIENIAIRYVVKVGVMGVLTEMKR
jgi:hypothetical protein